MSLIRELFALFLAWALIRNVSSGDCPKPKDLAPCTCDSEKGEVKCSHIDTNDILNRAFKSLKSEHTEVRLFTLQNSSLHDIPKELFVGTQFLSLNLTSVTTSNLFSGPAEGLDEIDFMVLTDVKSSGVWNWKWFSLMKKLRSVYLLDTDLGDIPRSFSEDITSQVEMLSFANTSTKSIKRGAFANLSKLSVFICTLNRLTEVDRKIFPRTAEKLAFLDFSYNEIRSLPGGSFKGLPKLQSLSLIGNNLSTLDASTFLPLLNKIILATRNPLYCDCSMKWIATQARQGVKDFDGQCSGPRSLKGKSLTELTPNDLHCGFFSFLSFFW